MDDDGAEGQFTYSAHIHEPAEEAVLDTQLHGPEAPVGHDPMSSFRIRRSAAKLNADLRRRVAQLVRALP